MTEHGLVLFEADALFIENKLNPQALCVLDLIGLSKVFIERNEKDFGYSRVNVLNCGRTRLDSFHIVKDGISNESLYSTLRSSFGRQAENSRTLLVTRNPSEIAAANSFGFTTIGFAQEDTDQFRRLDSLTGDRAPRHIAGSLSHARKIICSEIGLLGFAAL